MINFTFLKTKIREFPLSVNEVGAKMQPIFF